MTETTSNNPPVKRFQLGGVQVNVWKNVTDGKPFYNITIEYRYNANRGGGEADWRSSKSISERDIGNAVMLMQRAGNWIAFVKDREASKGE